jgi:hypothetical protein
MGVHSVYWSQSGQAWWVPLGSYMGLVAFFLLLGASWWVLKGDAFKSPKITDEFEDITEAPRLDIPEEKDDETWWTPWKRRFTAILNSL